MTDWYCIRLRGHLDAEWAEWFAGLQITPLATGETALVGMLDQTALHGVLARIRDLNLILLAVNQIDEQAATNVETKGEER